MTLSNKIIFLLLFPLMVFGQTDLMNYNNNLKFARYLTTTRQYDFALEEYERLNFTFPTDTIVIYELTKTYRIGEKCQNMDRINKLVTTKKKLFKTPVLTNEIIYMSLICKDFRYYDKFLGDFDKEFQEYFKLSKYWISEDYDKLKKYSFNITPQYKPYKSLYQLTEKFKKIKYKKTGLAIMMSAIIPGSGKMYAKRWGDGIMSFIFVVSNTVLSYRAFQKKGIKSTNGWIFGGFAVSFYAGNLWGSYKAVKDYN